MSAPWAEWWGAEPSRDGLRPLEPLGPTDSLGVCGECDIDTPAEQRHCGHECPVSVFEARVHSRYGATATVHYPRIVRLGVPT